MSVFAMNQAAQDKLFLEYIMPGLNVEIRENTVLYDRFKTRTDKIYGKYAVFKAMTANAKSFRPSSSSTLPTAKQGTYDEFYVYLKRGGYGQLQFDGLALATGKGKGAIMDVLEAELKGFAIQVANKMNRQYHGDGSGRLAQVVGAVSNSTTVVVDGPLFGQDANKRTNPAQYIDEGMECDFYSTAGVLEDDKNSIYSITDNLDGTATLVMDRALTCTNNAYIFDHDTYASSQQAGVGVPMGLNGIISTADPYVGITQVSFQGVDRDTKTWNRAINVSCSSQPISDDKLLELVQTQELYGHVSVLLMNQIIWRAYAKILKSEGITTNETSLWGGFEGITFYGGRKGKIPMVYDTDTPDNLVYSIDDSHISIYAPSAGGLTWIPGDSGILERVQGKDESVASMVFYYNMGCDKPQSQGYLSSVKHSAT